MMVVLTVHYPNILFSSILFFWDSTGGNNNKMHTSTTNNKQPHPRPRPTHRDPPATPTRSPRLLGPFTEEVYTALSAVAVTRIAKTVSFSPSLSTTPRASGVWRSS